MKVRLVSFSDEGGAGLAARRITAALSQEPGLEVRLLLAQCRQPDPTSILLQRDARADNRLIRYLRNRRATHIRKAVQKHRPIEHPIFSVPWGDYEDDLERHVADADIIHLHWVAGLFDLRRFVKRLPTRAQLVWTLHDMLPITGGYHYQASMDPSRMTAYEQRVIQRHTAAIQSIRDRVTCCAPSEWLTGLAASSPVFSGVRTTTLRNCVDVQTFRPSDKAAAREALGIPNGLPTLLFVNHNHDDPNKGLDLLLHAITLLRKKGMRFQTITVGKNGHSTHDTVHLGAIHEANRMAQVYNAADLFVIPSRLDNYPNTVIEAFACGVPAVGAATGGIPEQILDGKTGHLFQERSAEVLAQTLHQTFSNPGQLRAFSQHCLDYVATHNHPQPVAQAHLNLYRSLVAPTPDHV